MAKITVGIEEEFFLVDDKTLLPVETLPAAARDRLTAELGSDFELEFFTCQGELRTGYSTDLREVATDYRRKRRLIGEVLKPFGIVPLHCGTHPAADWVSLPNKLPKVRTPDLFSMNGRRSLTCGFHVHIGCGSLRRRVLLLNFLRPLIPVLVALSSSSPFWRGQNTDLHSYRISVFGAVRTGGLPPRLSARGFSKFRQAMTKHQFPNELVQPHWLIRPSVKYPTVETRVMDTCANPDDAIAIAALLQCLADFAQARITTSSFTSTLVVRGRIDRALGDMIAETEDLYIRENIWRAQRDSLGASMLISGTWGVYARPLRSVLELLLEHLEMYSRARGYDDHFVALRELCDRGPVSVRQVATLAQHGLDPADRWREVAKVALSESLVFD